jgi:hypothetical protein
MPRADATTTPAAATPAAPMARAGAAGVAEPEPERPGCGWYESSHALRTGLLVRELEDPSALPPDLPLSAWLALHLDGWRPGLRA